MKTAVEPDLQRQTRMIGRPALRGRWHDNAQSRQGQLIDKLAEETGRMVPRNPVFQRGRRKKLQDRGEAGSVNLDIF